LISVEQEFFHAACFVCRADVCQISCDSLSLNCVILPESDWDCNLGGVSASLRVSHRHVNCVMCTTDTDDVKQLSLAPLWQVIAE